METEFIQALANWYEIRSVGLFPMGLPARIPVASDSPGLSHALHLLDKPPEFWHRWHSLRRLKIQYEDWQREGWTPDFVLALNLTPVYNAMVAWLTRINAPPRRVLWLSDSTHLGRTLSRFKRWRYQCKPFYIPDTLMASRFHACLGLSKHTEVFFAERRIPWLWLPGGCLSQPAPGPVPSAGPIAFGYFGALAAHAGIVPLIKTFLAWSQGHVLHICGYGKLSAGISRQAQNDARLCFHGLLPSPADCLALAQQWDVLINPRPDGWGNENSFPSKIFQYALCGRAILSTRLSGVQDVLGPRAHYFDETDFDRSLPPQLEQLSRTPRSLLRAEGLALHRHIITQYSWTRQAARCQEFLDNLIRDGSC